MYPRNSAPSQRFRFEHFLPYLEEASFQVDFYPFFSAASYQTLYSKGHVLAKIWSVVFAFLQRFAAVWASRKADFVFIQRAATPIGPPFFEWLLAKVFGRKIVYDFDDAIWVHDFKSKSLIAKYLRFHSKTGKICRWAHKVSVGNEFLADYARQFSSRVVLIPTCVDTEKVFAQTVEHHSKTASANVGWTGTFTTLPYLDNILPALQKMDKLPEINQIIVICNNKPEYDLNKIHYISWKEDTEISDLSTLQIGLMPLEDTAWTKGKCGFKAIQYMALGIPAIVSPVAVNRKIVLDGLTGFHAESMEDWVEKTRLLASNPELRAKMGFESRRHIVENFSIRAHKTAFLQLFS